MGHHQHGKYEPDFEWVAVLKSETSDLNKTTAVTDSGEKFHVRMIPSYSWPHDECFSIQLKAVSPYLKSSGLTVHTMPI